MQTRIQTISTAELPSRATERRRTRTRTLLRPVRSVATWWADDLMNARFEQQREHDRQMLHRHGRR
jgi:hypothetical protein